MRTLTPVLAGVGLLLAAALSLAAPAPARADVLAGGPVYANGPSGQAVGCFLFNAGPAAVTLSSVAILGPNGQPISTFQNTCGASVGAGQLCGLLGIAGPRSAYACKASTPGGAGAYLRGSVGAGTITDPEIVAVPLQLTPEG
jgi:hypothetical protein